MDIDPKELKSIDFDQGYFYDKHGKKVLIQINRLSVARYSKYIQFTPQVSFGVNFEELFDSFKKIFEATTNGSDIMKGLHTASTEAMNQMEAIKGLLDDVRRPAVLWFCALFCNYEDENIAEWDQDKMQQKIDAWDNINIYDFFVLAINAIKGLKDEYLKLREVVQELEKMEKYVG
jgi:hypothetical protein